MPDNPVLSVIIPTRDCLRWLPSAIASVGPRADIEIIVVDDGSTDGTGDWLAGATRSDPRLVVLRAGGVGVARARNLAIAAARATLIAFLDADDRWHPDKLAVQLAAHQSWPDACASFTDYRHVTETGEDRGACFAYWRRFRARVAGRAAPFLLGAAAPSVLFAENVVGTSTVIARTDALRALGGFCADLPSSEDWDLWLRLARHGPLLCVPRVLADYLMHRPGNLTGQGDARLRALGMIRTRHQREVGRISPSARRCFHSHLLEARAERARQRGQSGRDLGLRLAAFAWAPSRRGAREALAALRRALGFGQRGGYSARTAATPAARP